MNKDKLAPFGYKCKHRLLDECMTMTELARQVNEDTGLYCDVRYLLRIFYGERHPKKIIDSICKILEIDYE